MAKKRHEWFIWPKNGHANEVIARMAQNGDNRFEEGTLTDAMCEDGKKRNLWRTSEDNAWFLWRSRIDLKFEIFNRLGNGKIRNVTFLFRRDRRSPKKSKAKERGPSHAKL